METVARDKNIHVKLNRDTHIRFKAYLVSIDSSMQEAFEFFAQCVADGNKTALRMVDQMKRQRIKNALEGTGLKPGLAGRRRSMGELDPDTLYDIINEADDDEASLPAEG